MKRVAGRRRRMVFVFLFVVVITLVPIAAGVFDPKPRGREVQRSQLWLQAIPAGARRVIWLDEEPSTKAYSLRLTAASHSGEADVGFGLLIGDETGHLALAVSPLGYVSLWLEEVQADTRAGTTSFLQPWQPWPHVKTGRTANELWIERESEHFSVRVNRERLWQGDLPGLGDHIGLYSESFGESAEIKFDTIEIYTRP